MYRLVRWAVLVAAAWMTVRGLPSLARYLKMREM
jgi:hypothetical protein